MIHRIKKTSITSGIFTASLFVVALLPLTNTAHAQTPPIISQLIPSSIGSTFKDAFNTKKETAAKNSVLRNQLVVDHSSDLQDKETAFVDQLNATLLNLENIQTRIAAKTAETAAAGTDTYAVDSWLATSSDDIIIAHNDISIFAESVSSTSEVSAIFGNKSNIIQARKLANDAIDAVNTAHDDLQSALDALTAIL